jgi:hypothetical protein
MARSKAHAASCQPSFVIPFNTGKKAEASATSSLHVSGKSFQDLASGNFWNTEAADLIRAQVLSNKSGTRLQRPRKRFREFQR